jgi:hypothetical protein
MLRPSAHYNALPPSGLADAASGRWLAMERGIDTPEVRREIESETSASALGARGRAPMWLLPALAVVLLGVTLYVVLRQQPAAIHLIVLGAILVVVIGLIVAINPRRRSPAGGTEER